MTQIPRPDEDQDVIVHYIKAHSASSGAFRHLWTVFVGNDKRGDADDLANAERLSRELARQHHRPAWLLDADGYPLKPIPLG